MPEHNERNNLPDARPERQGAVPHERNGLIQVQHYSGPLPPAVEFEKYEKVLKGSADRILKLAENQNQHRRFIEKVVVIVDSLTSMAGLIGALAIVAGGMWAGVYLIMNDKPTAGFVAMLVPLGTVAAAFLYQKYKEDDDNDDKE